MMQKYAAAQNAVIPSTPLVLMFMIAIVLERFGFPITSRSSL